MYKSTDQEEERGGGRRNSSKSKSGSLKEGKEKEPSFLLQVMPEQSVGLVFFAFLKITK